MLERFTVVFHFCRTDVTAGRGNQIARADFFELYGFAEAGCVRVNYDFGFEIYDFGTLRVIRLLDFLNCFRSQFPVMAVNEHAHFPRVYEKRLCPLRPKAGVGS